MLRQFDLEPACMFELDPLYVGLKPDMVNGVWDNLWGLRLRVAISVITMIFRGIPTQTKRVILVSNISLVLEALPTILINRDGLRGISISELKIHHEELPWPAIN